jgi:acyl-CoA reductase-like NAD-dependent aldehyde dehydrogenase
MRLNSIDPRTGKMIKTYRMAEKPEVEGAFEKARKGAAVWSSSAPQARIDALRRAEAAFTRRKDELTALASSEVGFREEDLAAELHSALAGVEHYSRRLLESGERDFPLDQAKWKETRARVEFLPHGVVAHIGIWNYPIWQTLVTAIPGLLAGNAFVFKPAEACTGTGLLIADILHEAGVPENAYVPLVGGGDVGRQMVLGDSDCVTFTGGIDTGIDIIRNAGVKPLILELSGNDAAIVCADADIEQAARGLATAAFSRAGQICIRPKRVYVDKAVADAFLERFMRSARALDVRGRVGPLVREEARQKVDVHVRNALRSGAELLLGGKPLSGAGYYYEPTVLLMRRPNREIAAKEIFGPVCPIFIAEDDDDAVQRANDSTYGLGATIWTQDQAKARRIASRLQSGYVWINEWGRTLVAGEYFNGWKSSGLASSSDRLMMFMKKRAVIEHFSNEPRASWVP